VGPDARAQATDLVHEAGAVQVGQVIVEHRSWRGCTGKARWGLGGVEPSFKRGATLARVVDALARLALEAVRAYREAPLDADTVELMADLEHAAQSSR
jgi:hypothetical protein